MNDDLLIIVEQGSDDTTMRTLAPYQCSPGSIPGPGVMWVEFVVDSCPCSEFFFTPNFNLTWNQWTKRATSRSAAAKLINLFILLSQSGVKGPDPDRPGGIKGEPGIPVRLFLFEFYNYEMCLTYLAFLYNVLVHVQWILGPIQTPLQSCAEPN